MDIYDPIAKALDLSPILFDYNTPPQLDNNKKIEAWNKGINQFGSKENHFMFGKSHTEETKQKIARKATGRIHSEETKRKMSDIRIGLTPPCSMLGKTHSEETKKKMSLSSKGFSDKARQKQKEHMLGKKLSDETRAKMRQAAINRNRKS